MASDVIVVDEKRTNDGSCHRVLFNDLVGAARQRNRNGNTEFFGGFCIDEQLELSTLLDWQIGGLFSPEDARHVNTGQPVRIDDIAAIAREPTRGGEPP